jgi:hypothetical protein
VFVQNAVVAALCLGLGQWSLSVFSVWRIVRLKCYVWCDQDIKIENWLCNAQ